jgi:hypothetical protein
MRQYADAHGGKLPPAASWQSDIKAIYAKASAKNKKEGNPFGVMPAEGQWGCEANGAKTGFAYNSSVAGKKLADLPSDTILVFEVPQTGMNLAMPYKAQDPNQSPKIMNERRGWFVAPVSGEAHLISPKGKSVTISANGGTNVKVDQ